MFFKLVASSLWLVAVSATFAQQPTDLLVRSLNGGDPAEVLQAAEAIQKQTPKSPEELDLVADAVKSALSSTRDPLAEASLRLALGKLAAAGVEDAAEWGFESMSVTHSATTPPAVFERMSAHWKWFPARPRS